MTTKRQTVMRSARETSGLTQAQLAKELKVSQPAVSAWESGHKAIPDGRRSALAETLGVDPATLERDPTAP